MSSNMSENANLSLIHYKPKELPHGFQIFSSSVRRYFADKYPHPLFNNHYPDGRSIYRSRGAPFQFKVINNEVYILALNEGVEFAQSFMWPDAITMPIGNNGFVIELELSSKETKHASYQPSSLKCYRNISPYIALNQDKQKAYLSLTEEEKRKAIEKGLANHILAAAKWCGVTVTHRIQTNLIQLKTGIPIKIKDELKFPPFDVMFESNTEIPDYIGIGKFVSRGYGTLVHYG